MFLSDKFVYVDLNKTGSVSVLNWLDALGVPSRKMMHHSKPSLEIIRSDRIKVATIRDPWSFYLSLWSYGCKHRNLSGPYNALTKFQPHKSRGGSYGKWRAARSLGAYLIRSLKENWSYNLYLYSDNEDPELFRIWLGKVLDPKTATLLSGSYYGSGIHRIAGLYSYRYCNLYCQNSSALHSLGFRSVDDLIAWESENCYIDEFMQTASLGRDFTDFARRYRLVNSTFDLDSVVGQRMNMSKAKGIGITEFYDDVAVALVKEREAMIINKFDYHFDNLASC